MPALETLGLFCHFGGTAEALASMRSEGYKHFRCAEYIPQANDRTLLLPCFRTFIVKDPCCVVCPCGAIYETDGSKIRKILDRNVAREGLYHEQHRRTRA